MNSLAEFREIWLVDFEFFARPGSRPSPICVVALELRTGRKLVIWQDELRTLKEAPFALDEASLFVAYYASAEFSCHLALGWALPVNALDLYVEFRNATNGLPVPGGNGLLGALHAFGLDGNNRVDKDKMRSLALRGGPWTSTERAALLDYCDSDVTALSTLLSRMERLIDLPRALLRGRYMKAVSHIEHHGIPLDVHTLAALRQHWPFLKARLIEKVDAAYRVFEGGSFKVSRWDDWLRRQGIPWPRLPSGRLDLKNDTFREMARIYPAVAPMKELRATLSQLRLTELAVGPDARNRALLSPFRAKTGRNQPKSSQFIFGPAKWVRGLVKPEFGYGIAYIDWEQQEFGIAAALSGDAKMVAAYLSGDPYLEFAKQCGAVPPHATRTSHGAIRDQFKAVALAVQYGMGAESLAFRIKQPVARARQLLQLHRETYRVFWRWSDAAVDQLMVRGKISTVFGWELHAGEDVNPRSIRNFPMQANGAEMLRWACIFATERGINVFAPVHDAILIEAPLDKLDEGVHATQEAMAKASRLVLSGFRLRTDARVIRYPDRFDDERSSSMWDVIMELMRDAS